MDKTTEALAIKELAKNTPQRDIAKELNVSQSSISRVKKNNELAIQKEAEKLIAVLPDIVTTLSKELETADLVTDVIAGNKQLSELSDILQSEPKLIQTVLNLNYKNRVDILKALGVYPGQVENSFIQNIFKEGSKNIISPNIMQVIGKHIQENMKDVIDVEVKD